MERLHRVRIMALDELGKVARPSDSLAVEAAGERVADKDPTVRVKAIETLAKLCPKGSDMNQVAGMLLRHLEGGTDSVRRSAAEALSVVCKGDGGAVFRLAAIVKDHHSQDVRSIAFEALTMVTESGSQDQTGKMLDGVDQRMMDSWSAFKKVSKLANEATSGAISGGVGTAPILVTKTLVPGLNSDDAGLRWTSLLVMTKVLTEFQPGKGGKKDKEEPVGAAATLAARKKAEADAMRNAKEDPDENELFKGRWKKGLGFGVWGCSREGEKRAGPNERMWMDHALCTRTDDLGLFPFATSRTDIPSEKAISLALTFAIAETR